MRLKALQWWQSVPAERRERSGFSITPELEARALAAWRARVPAGSAA